MAKHLQNPVLPWFVLGLSAIVRLRQSRLGLKSVNASIVSSVPGARGSGTQGIYHKLTVEAHRTGSVDTPIIYRQCLSWAQIWAFWSSWLLDFLNSQSPRLSRSSIICRDGRWLPILTSKPWWPMSCPWSAYSETQQILDISWEQETWWISTLPLTGRFRKNSEPNARHIPTVSLTSIALHQWLRLLTTIPQFRTFSHRELLQHHSVWSRWRDN